MQTRASNHFENEMPKKRCMGSKQAISELATGEYIAIHHSDDVWESEKLAKQVAFLDANSEVGARFHMGKNKLTNTAHVRKRIGSIKKTRHDGSGSISYFLESNHLNHPAYLLESGGYQEVGMYRYGLAQDG